MQIDEMACLSDTLLGFLIKACARAEGPTGSHAHEEVDFMCLGSWPNNVCCISAPDVGKGRVFGIGYRRWIGIVL